MAETLCLKTDEKDRNPSVIVKDGILQMPGVLAYSVLGTNNLTNQVRFTTNGNSVSAHQLLMTIDVTNYSQLHLKGYMQSWYQTGGANKSIPAVGFTNSYVTANNSNYNINIGSNVEFIIRPASGDRIQSNFDTTIDITAVTGHKMLAFSVSGVQAWSGYITFTDIYFS